MAAAALSLTHKATRMLTWPHCGLGELSHQHPIVPFAEDLHSASPHPPGAQGSGTDVLAIPGETGPVFFSCSVTNWDADSSSVM